MHQKFANFERFYFTSKTATRLRHYQMCDNSVLL